MPFRKEAPQSGRREGLQLAPEKKKNFFFLYNDWAGFVEFLFVTYQTQIAI
jgi:hypothetical protein